jgi:hypothetical protein
MKDGRLASFGLTSLMLIGVFVACESSESGTAVDTSLDAGSVSLADAATTTPPVVVHDASVDATVDEGVVVVADVAKDFATRANPNGTWTYGYSVADPRSADAGALVVFSAVSTATPDIPAWDDPSNIVLGAPAAWRNDSAATNTSIAPGEFALHPGQAGEYAVARWTAPAAGVYAVMVQFKTGDTGDTNGLLLHNGVALVTEDSTSTDTVHELQVTLAAHDHLDAAVGSKGDFLYDSTPVHFTIKSVGANR